MADVTVKRTEEFEAMYGGGLLRARAGLGVTSFGMQIIRMPPNAHRYPEHDHAHDGQEEVYILLSGAATLQAGGEEYALERGVFVRVGPGEKRKILTAEEGVEILALGGIPGEPFDVKQITEEGEPDPLGEAGDA
jgi:quercetin dioxygenase-like cupin family protein